MGYNRSRRRKGEDFRDKEREKYLRKELRKQKRKNKEGDFKEEDLEEKERIHLTEQNKRLQKELDELKKK